MNLFLSWAVLGFFFILLFFVGQWEQFAIVDNTIEEDCVSKQQLLGGERILQFYLLPTFCNCNTKLIVVVALGLFVCTHHPQGTNVFLNSYASCYMFTLGDADKRVRNGKILCVPDLGL